MSNRTAYLIAFALIGAGIGLLVAEWTLLDVNLGGLRKVFDATAVGSAALGGYLIRKYERPHLLAPIGAGLAAVGIACGTAYALAPMPGDAELVTRQLPGFTIDLPTGDAKLDETGEYATGDLLVAINGASAICNIMWEPGGGYGPAGMKSMAKGIFAGVDIGSAEPELTAIDGIPTVRAETDKGLLEASVEVCGVRRVLVVTEGQRTETLHRRILASFKCHPDAAKDQRTASIGFPMTFDLPGWWAFSRHGLQVQVTDGRRIIMLLGKLRTGMDGDVVQLLETVFKGQDTDVRVTPDGDGRASLVLKMKHGPEARGIARVIHCSTKAALVIAVTPDDQTADLAAIIDGGHCPKPGEPGQTFKDGPKPKV